MGQSDLDLKRLEKFFEGKATPEEQVYIEYLFSKKENEGELRKILSRKFTKVMSEEAMDDISLEHILHRIHYNINVSEAGKKKNRFFQISLKVLRIAGLIILPFLVYWGLRGFYTVKAREEAWTEIMAPAWTRAQFTLPDGSTGWLNSNSSVRYNLDFVNDRHLILNGEAFFDVYKDTDRPFRVSTNDVVLKVLGTRFNVASYDNEPNIEVVLEDGILVFNDDEHKDIYSMNPSDLVIWNKKKKEMTSEVVQTQKYLSWKDGKLVFRNDPLDVICRRLGRWYNVDVEMKVAAFDNLRLRATFVDENLETVLDLLKRSLPIDYRIQEGRLNTDNTYSRKKVIILPRTK